MIATIRSHKITGAMFLSLDDEQLKELFPTLGDRMSVKHLLKKFTDTVTMANENDTSKHSYLPVIVFGKSKTFKNIRMHRAGIHYWVSIVETRLLRQF